MSFQIKDTKKRVKHIYKTLYISETLVSKIDSLAYSNSTSFNNIIISMIESCLKDEEKSPET